MLEVIISPAKQMRVARDAFAPQGIPPYPRETERLWRALCDIERAQGPVGLRTLWGVNEKLLTENVERLHDFASVTDVDALDDAAVARRVSAAVFSYVGIQYRSMAPEVMDEDALAWLAGHLWILSGLYGCVRPFDAHYTRTLGVAWSDADNPAPAIRKFLDYISALPVGSGISPLHFWYSSSTDEKI